MANTLFDIILTKGQTKTKTVKQQQIIDSAITLFAKKGYANTSTSEIAKAAGVSEGAIFKHYGTKDHLLLSVILPFIKEFFPVLAQEVFTDVMAEDTAKFDELLLKLLKNRAAFIDENKEIFRVVVKEILYKDELKKELLPYFIQILTPFYSTVLEEFKKRGELIDKPTGELIQYVLLNIGGFIISRVVLFDNSALNDQEIENAVRLMMTGIRNPQKGE
ncbi:TetR/AcrR family transcriptional regulator [Paenibacillus ihuae]|uniref:TetR/AcrR family transcriptional regulator n=1 Tax=Paenibacillus ihuae TaxID=1232431 RepID=UPI0006D56AD9|nr:TetR/AcrR family transcriptional regulator [Paenibacillus ihuae]